MDFSLLIFYLLKISFPRILTSTYYFSLNFIARYFLFGLLDLLMSLKYCSNNSTPIQMSPVSMHYHKWFSGCSFLEYSKVYTFHNNFLTVHPGVQSHWPVFASQEPPFWHSHICWHWSPCLPTGHSCSHLRDITHLHDELSFKIVSENICTSISKHTTLQ